MNQRKLDTCTRPLFYREIPLTQGQVALVDVEDYDRIVAMGKWCACYDASIRGYYARRNGKYVNGKRLPMVHMHRVVMGVAPDDPLQVDHIETVQTLDNRKFNLRIADGYGQAFNRRKRVDNTAGYKGVDWHTKAHRWQARIMANGIRYHLGYFLTPEAAYSAYCDAALRLHKGFARLA